MAFLALKTLHISFVVCSYFLFVLLTSAIALALTIRQYPFVDSWLTAKVVGLLLYVGLGLSHCATESAKPSGFFAGLAAQAVFFYIVLVAMTHRPMPW